ncbi:MAG: FtsX-like permease family protein [Acidobacteriota bacterium]|nr:FtsX-like permease family protein [Acidobacteriota bacterium]
MIRFTLRALQYRKRRLLLSFAALATSAALATVLFEIYSTAEGRMRDQFRSSGANLAAVPITGQTVPLALADSAEKLGATAAPFLITSTDVSHQTPGPPILIAGFIPQKAVAMTAYWHMRGSRDIGSRECLAGELLASRLHIGIGSSVPLGDTQCTVKGIVSTGSDEDQEVLVPFEIAAKLAGIQNAASIIEIRAPGDRLEQVRNALAKEFPQADVRTMRAVAETESNVVLKIRRSLFLLMLFILAITTLCVTSNFSGMVIERSKEIGILKALGAVERRIAALFVSESVALAFAATIAGYLAGLFAAAAIGREVFGGVFHLHADWLTFAAVGGVMLSVAAVSTGIAASRIWSIQPAIILRSE